MNDGNYVTYEMRYKLNAPLAATRDFIEHPIDDIDGQIIKHTFNGNNAEEQPVGRFKGHYLNADKANMNGYDLIDRLEATANVAAIYDHEGRLSEDLNPDGFYTEDVLVLSLLEIDSSERGKELGLMVIEDAVERFRRDAQIAALYAFPLQFSAGNCEDPDYIQKDKNEKLFKAFQKKLMSYYSQAGFKEVNNSGVMYKIVGL